MSEARRHDREHGTGPWDEETAAAYVAEWGDHATNRLTVEVARLAPDDIVLDIGCGAGEAMRHALARVSRGRVIGVDPTPAMIRHARRSMASDASRNRAEFHEAAAERLPLPDASVTVAWAVNSLHHWSQRPTGLAEAHRVLRPGGRFLAADEESDEGRVGHDDGALRSPAAIAEAVAAAGFVGVEVTRHRQGDVRMIVVSGHKPTTDG